MFQDDFQIINELAGGSGSRLYLVNDRISGQKKVLKKPVAPLRENALAELMLLSGPNLVRYEGLTEDGFLIMGCVSGETLSEKLHKKGHFSENETVLTGIGICEALEQLQPYVFGDLKPVNIMVSNEIPVLIDLDGIFAEGGHTAQFGTMGYAAPEQMSDQAVNPGPAADIYSLGIILLQLLSGISPAAFPVESWQKNPEQSALGIPSELWKVLMKAVREDPGERYQSAKEMREALEKLKTPDTEIKRTGKRARIAIEISCAVLTIVFTALFCFRIKQDRSLHEQYQKILESADAPEDILQAIALLPAEESGYDMLFSALSADGVLAAEEKEVLQKLQTGIDCGNQENSEVIPALDRLKKENPDGFENVCLCAGKLLLFYEEEEPGIADYQAAAKWLEKIPENEEAAVYLAIGQAAEQLEEMEHSRSFEGLGEVCISFWDHIQNLKQEAAGEKSDMSILICRECLRLTDRYLGLLETEISEDALQQFSTQMIQIGEMDIDENTLQKKEREKLRMEAENLAARIGKENSS